MKISVRILHRYIGFFMLGVMSVYAISGIILTYRDTNIFKYEKTIERKLDSNLEAKDLEQILHLRGFKVDKTDKDKIYFNSGIYNKKTGIVKYIQMQNPEFINKMSNLHKTKSAQPLSWFTTIFGIGLLFLALSSLWMFKSKTKVFKKGIMVAALGLIFTIILIMW